MLEPGRASSSVALARSGFEPRVVLVTPSPSPLPSSRLAAAGAWVVVDSPASSGCSSPAAWAGAAVVEVGAAVVAGASAFGVVAAGRRWPGRWWPEPAWQG